MRNLAFAAASAAVVAFGLSAVPASAFTFQANPPPDYALPDAGYQGGGSAFAPGGAGYGYQGSPAPFAPLAAAAGAVGAAAYQEAPPPAPVYNGSGCNGGAAGYWSYNTSWPLATSCP